MGLIIIIIYLIIFVDNYTIIITIIIIVIVIIMPPHTIGGRGIMFLGRPSVHLYVCLSVHLLLLFRMTQSLYFVKI